MNKRTSMFMALGVLTLTVGLAIPALAVDPSHGPGSGIKNDSMSSQSQTGSTRSSEAVQPNTTPIPGSDYSRTSAPDADRTYQQQQNRDWERSRDMNYNTPNRDINYNTPNRNVNANPSITEPNRY